MTKHYLIRRLLVADTAGERAEGLSVVSLTSDCAPTLAMLAGREPMLVRAASFKSFDGETAGVEQLDGAMRITYGSDGSARIDFFPPQHV